MKLFFVADFESAASELAQSDSDLSAAFTTYVEARRKLGEKFRARGFFPISKDKSKGFGKGKSKFKASWSSRRSLQQRIMNSNCRLRGRQGHWKSECPNRSQSGGSSSTSAPVTLSVGVTSSDDKDIMPDEFLLLPEVIPEAHSRDSVAETEMCCVKTVLFQGSTLLHIHHCTESHVTTARDRIRNFIKGNRVKNSRVASLVSRIEFKIQQAQMVDRPQCRDDASANPNAFRECKPECRSQGLSSQSSKGALKSKALDSMSPIPVDNQSNADVCFSTHDTWGILDTGATNLASDIDLQKDYRGLSDRKRSPTA